MEIELKLLGSPRDLARLRRTPLIAAAVRGETRSALLRAVYFDTPALDLKGRGVALRMRREGRGWVQCIKGPGEAIGGLHRREELEWAVPDETPELSLLCRSPFGDLFREPRIRRSLRPVFSMEFQRRTVELDLGGDSAAELALDTGEMRAGRRKAPISEAELELVRGKPEAVLDFALGLVDALPLRIGYATKAARGYALAEKETPQPFKAGELTLDPEAAAAAACVRIFDDCAAQIHRNEQGFLDGSEPEYLHQLRVGLRRLRAALGMPRDMAWREALHPLRADLQWLSRSLSRARDWDVFVEEVRRMLHKTQVPGRRRLSLQMAREWNSVLQDARNDVRAARYQQLWLQLAKLAVVHAGTIAPQTSTLSFAKHTLSRRYARLIRHGEPRALDNAALHAIRIDAKKLRYSAEFFLSLWQKKEGNRFVETLKRLQDVLGRISDASAGRAIMAQLGTAGGASGERGAHRLVFEGIEEAEAAARAQLAMAWKRFVGTRPHWT